ncbi:MAG: transposase, partial [Firmicutes bacterium]|nr:transposase [Bacillota bacterium]
MPSSSNTSKSRKTSEESPSFICEIPLKVLSGQEMALLARLEAARQVYNACVGEAIRRLNLVRQSKPYRMAIGLAKGDPGRNALFAEARGKHGFKDAALQHYAVVLRRSWIGDHLDVHTTQKLATRAFHSVARVLYGQAKRVRFKGKNQLDSVESKNNAAGIRWREDHVEW